MPAVKSAGPAARTKSKRKAFSAAQIAGLKSSSYARNQVAKRVVKHAVCELPAYPSSFHIHQFVQLTEVSTDRIDQLRNAIAQSDGERSAFTENRDASSSASASESNETLCRNFAGDAATGRMSFVAVEPFVHRVPRSLLAVSVLCVADPAKIGKLTNPNPGNDATCDTIMLWKHSYKVDVDSLFSSSSSATGTSAGEAMEKSSGGAFVLHCDAGVTLQNLLEISNIVVDSEATDDLLFVINAAEHIRISANTEHTVPSLHVPSAYPHRFFHRGYISSPSLGNCCMLSRVRPGIDLGLAINFIGQHPVAANIFSLVYGSPPHLFSPSDLRKKIDGARSGLTRAPPTEIALLSHMLQLVFDRIVFPVITAFYEMQKYTPVQLLSIQQLEHHTGYLYFPPFGNFSTFLHHCGVRNHRIFCVADFVLPICDVFFDRFVLEPTFRSPPLPKVQRGRGNVKIPLRRAIETAFASSIGAAHRIPTLQFANYAASFPDLCAIETNAAGELWLVRLNV